MNPNPRAGKPVSKYKLTLCAEGLKRMGNSIIELIEKLLSGPAICNLSRTKMASFLIDSKSTFLECELPYSSTQKLSDTHTLEFSFKSFQTNQFKTCQ